jgi:cyclin C
MASNYWTSSQFKYWSSLAKQYRRQVSIQEEQQQQQQQQQQHQQQQSSSVSSSSNRNTTSTTVAGSNTGVSVTNVTFTELEKRMLMIEYVEMMRSLGEKLQLHQRVISTAIVFVHRFYLKNDILDCDPLLLVPTALLLASKVEECPHNYKSSIVTRLPSDYPYGMHMIIECEAYLMEQLNFNLCVYHAYKPLEMYIRHLEHATYNPRLDMTRNYQMCINFINDSYYSTTLCLEYPPHLIALAAIYMCGIMFDQSPTGDNDWMRKWFYDLNVDMSEIANIVDDMLDMYKLIHMNHTGDKIGSILLKIDGIRREIWRKEQQQKLYHHQAPPPPTLSYQSIPHPGLNGNR